jgi:hypothetical protein
MENNLADKLKTVERTVNVYNVDTEDDVEEIIIDISVERLQNIVCPKNGDTLLYQGSLLNADQLEKINRELTKKIIPDFSLYYYVLECHRIYNWKLDFCRVPGDTLTN